LTFKKANGAIQFVQFGFRPAEKEGEVEFAMGRMTGSFQLAPDFIVVRKTRSSFLSSSTRDSIVYTPRALTDADISNLMAAIGYCTPQLAYLALRTDDGKHLATAH